MFAFEDAINETKGLGDGATMIRVNSAMIPAIIACVEEWRLTNFPVNPTPETFPATPISASMQVIAWLIAEISALFREAEDIPNA